MTPEQASIWIFWMVCMGSVSGILSVATYCVLVGKINKLEQQIKNKEIS